MKEQIEIMLALQEQMNTKVDPNWRQANNEWYRAIWVECGEMMEHAGYKWWKKQEPNMPQIQLEIVDCMHFMLAISLLNDEQPADIANAFSRSYHYTDIRDAIDALAYWQLEGKNEFTQYERLKNIMQIVNMDFNELFKQYCAKNVLNIFRQENGYKEGTYSKLWQIGRNTMEDNEVLSEILYAYDGTEENFMYSIKNDLTKIYKQNL